MNDLILDSDWTKDEKITFVYNNEMLLQLIPESIIYLKSLNYDDNFIINYNRKSFSYIYKLIDNDDNWTERGEKYLKVREQLESVLANVSFNL